MRLNGLLLALALGSVLTAQGRQTVPDSLRNKLRDYLLADSSRDTKALDALAEACKGDLKLADAAIRSMPPLRTFKPGIHHREKLTVDGKVFEMSLRLPEGYDGKTRLPVLLLPDHASVDAEAGIQFWEQSDHIEKLIVFRPVITRHAEDAKIFPKQAFLERDAQLARIMDAAITWLLLNVAADPERICMTGLSQAGYYTWYYAATMPDRFAGIVPESAGGPAVRATALSAAGNLQGMAVRILHTKDDAICPFADAESMQEAITKAGGKAELIAYTDADYPGAPFPKRHPGPHHLRVKNVLPWILEQKRTIPEQGSRVIRFAHQETAGRFRVKPPAAPTKPFTFQFDAKGGVLTAQGGDVTYEASARDCLDNREFRIAGRTVKPKPFLKLFFTTYKLRGDPDRAVAALIQ